MAGNGETNNLIFDINLYLYGMKTCIVLTYELSNQSWIDSEIDFDLCYCCVSRRKNWSLLSQTGFGTAEYASCVRKVSKFMRICTLQIRIFNLQLIEQHISWIIFEFRNSAPEIVRTLLQVSTFSDMVACQRTSSSLTMYSMSASSQLNLGTDVVSARKMTTQIPNRKNDVEYRARSPPLIYIRTYMVAGSYLHSREPVPYSAGSKYHPISL